MADFDVLSVSDQRVVALDGPEVVAGKHFMFALLEVDVTDLRNRIREMNRNGIQTSFNSWIIKAVGDCVSKNRHAQAIPHGSRKLVLFHDVDIVLPVVRTTGSGAEPVPLLLRSANRKTAEEINAEIQAFRDGVMNESTYVRDAFGISTIIQKLYIHLPRKLRLSLMRKLVSSPFRARKYVGTVYVTTVNAAGGLSGWMLPTRSACNLIVALGSVNERPWVVKGQIAVRDILHLTVGFNHSVIDGLPARNVLRDLIRYIENITAAGPTN